MIAEMRRLTEADFSDYMQFVQRDDVVNVMGLPFPTSEPAKQVAVQYALAYLDGTFNYQACGTFQNRELKGALTYFISRQLPVALVTGCYTTPQDYVVQSEALVSHLFESNPGIFDLLYVDTNYNFCEGKVSDESASVGVIPTNTRPPFKEIEDVLMKRQLWPFDLRVWSVHRSSFR